MSVQALINRHPDLHPARPPPPSLLGPLIVVWPAPGCLGMGVYCHGDIGSWYGNLGTCQKWGHPSGDPVSGTHGMDADGCSPLGTQQTCGDITLATCLKGGSGGTPLRTLQGSGCIHLGTRWQQRHPLVVTPAVGTSVSGHGGGRYIVLGTCWQ